MYKSTIIIIISLLIFCGQVSVGLEITIDGKFNDWEKVPVLIDDPKDIEEPNGDLKSIKVVAFDGIFYTMMTVYGLAAPPPPDNQRYYYHLLIDADNNIDTGFNNSEYEGNATGVEKPLGADFYIQIGRRNGNDDGIEIYFLQAGDQSINEGFEWMQSEDSLEIAVPFEMFDVPDFGDLFTDGQTMNISAFQEGSANSWECDWVESAEYTIGDTYPVDIKGKLPVIWANLKN